MGDMRTLYESILDTDKQIIDKTELDSVVVSIVHVFHDVFGEIYPIEKSKSTSSEYEIGNIKLDVKGESKLKQSIEQSIETKINEFKKQLKKKTQVKCSVQTRDYTVQNYYLKTYRLLFEFRINGSYQVMGLILLSKSEETVKILSSDDLLEKYLCKICTK